MAKKKDTTKPEPKAKDTGTRKPIESLESVKGSMGAGAEPPKRKRGRPSKAQLAAEQAAAEQAERDALFCDIELLEKAIASTSVVIASKRGPHWQLDDGQVQTLARVYNDVLEKYLPGLGQYAVEINAIGATIMILAPIALTEIELIRLRRQQADRTPEPLKDASSATPTE